MTPTKRTPQQRDRRFARVRRLAQVLLLGSGIVSGLLVTYLAGATKPVTAVRVSVPATSTAKSLSTTTTSPVSKSPAETDDASNSTSTSNTTTTTPPTTAPVTTTTVCYSSPSGHVTCY
jgi:hypothetical protein